jgi:hypothetical protein
LWVLIPGREVGGRVHVDLDLYRQQTGAYDLGVESLDTAGCVSPSRNPLERLSGVNDVNRSNKTPSKRPELCWLRYRFSKPHDWYLHAYAHSSLHLSSRKELYYRFIHHA